MSSHSPKEKFCPDCNKQRPASDFHRKNGAKDGLQGYCKEHQKRRAIVPMWKKQGIELTWDQFEVLREKQGNRCAICGKQPKDTPEPDKELAVDHDKTTKKIRGLLCMNCNTAMGKLNHDIALFQKAVNYLQQGAVATPSDGEGGRSCSQCL